MKLYFVRFASFICSCQKKIFTYKVIMIHDQYDVMPFLSHLFVCLFSTVYPEEFLPTYHSIKEGAKVTKTQLVSHNNN